MISREAQEAIRAEIADTSAEFAQKAGAPTDKPFFMVVCSAPQTGKSTYVTYLKNQGYFPENTQFLFGDAFLPMVAKEDRKHLHHPEVSAGHEADFFEFRDQLIGEAFDAGKNVVLESHLRSPERLWELMNQARAHGYEVIGVGLTTTPEMLFSEYGGKEFEAAGADARLTQRLSWASNIAKLWDQFCSKVDYAALYRTNFSTENGKWTSSIIPVSDHLADGQEHIYRRDHYDTFRQWQTVSPNIKQLDELKQHVEAPASAHGRSDRSDGMGEGAPGSDCAGEGASAESWTNRDPIERLSGFAPNR